MPLLTTEALVLRGYKLGETSKLVVLLTRDRGKLRAVARGARGARPRYQSALEPLSEVRATLYGRQGTELFRLGDAELLHSAFRAGTRSLESAMLLSGCAEMLDAFCPEGEVEEKTYRLALAVVRAAEAGANPELLGRYLEAWLLKLHGLYPSLDSCAVLRPATRRRPPGVSSPRARVRLRGRAADRPRAPRSRAAAARCWPRSSAARRRPSPARRGPPRASSSRSTAIASARTSSATCDRHA